MILKKANVDDIIAVDQSAGINLFIAIVTWLSCYFVLLMGGGKGRIKVKNILHFFRLGKFTRDFVFFVNQFFNDNHIFWVYGEDDWDNHHECIKFDNVKYFPKIGIKLNKKSTEKQLHMFDIIIYHGVFDNCIIEYFYRHKNLLKKLNLYFWGGDIPLLGRASEKWRKKYVIKNASAVITIIPQDYDDLKQEYCPRGKHFTARYYSDRSFIIPSIEEEKCVLDNSVVNIQIGNSATDTNNHINVLNMLSKYKDDNIRIYIPLSYGNKDYAEKVIQFGKEVFGEKLVALEQFIPLEEYSALLKNMNVAIFDMQRQQALGNISVLLWYGCKVFLHHNGKLWDFFAKDLNFYVSSTDQISDMTIEDFVAITDEEKRYNKELMTRKMLDKDEYIKAWEKVFTTVADKCENTKEGDM